MSPIALPRSLKARLTLWYALVLSCVLLGYGGMVFLFERNRLGRELEREMLEEIEAAEERVARDESGNLVWSPDHNHPGEEEPRVEVVAADGRLVHRGAAFATGRDARVLARICRVDGEPVTIRAARSGEAMRRELRGLALMLGLGLPAGVAAAAGGGYLLALRALSPIGEMADRARRITAERLSDRLPVENPGDEIGRLAVLFNETLERLESSFERLRRFTADASHELRTPLTALRAVGEVALRTPKDADACREVVGSMLEEADRLTRLVENLLVLSRADAGRARLECAPGDLLAFARQVASQLAVLAEEHRQTLVVEGSDGVPARFDPAVLRLALVNLLDNALKYGPPASRVRLAVARRAGEAVIEVEDRGPGIAPEHQARVFDRFYRVDESRSREAGGSGLGLAIARWAVEAHGGRIELESSPGDGCTFRIVLPVPGGPQGGNP